jgi:hypothetical protein
VAADPYAHLRDNAWRELAEIEGRLERGEIDEAGWHDQVAAIVVPAYLAAPTPWEQSGKSGSRLDWEYSRSLIAEALERDGTFLDVGCANGFLVESIVRWTPFHVEPFGLEIAPQLADLARRRLPFWADRIAVGNAADWRPARRFTYSRTNLDYVPRRHRRELVEHLRGLCDRLIVGVFNEHKTERTIEDELSSWGLEIDGRSARPNRRKPGMEYRMLWIDAQ